MVVEAHCAQAQEQLGGKIIYSRKITMLFDLREIILQ
jgi:hypothetical protein